MMEHHAQIEHQQIQQPVPTPQQITMHHHQQPQQVQLLQQVQVPPELQQIPQPQQTQQQIEQVQLIQPQVSQQPQQLSQVQLIQPKVSQQPQQIEQVQLIQPQISQQLQQLPQVQQTQQPQQIEQVQLIQPQVSQQPQQLSQVQQTQQPQQIEQVQLIQLKPPPQLSLQQMKQQLLDQMQMTLEPEQPKRQPIPFRIKEEIVEQTEERPIQPKSLVSQNVIQPKYHQNNRQTIQTQPALIPISELFDPDCGCEKCRAYQAIIPIEFGGFLDISPEDYYSQYELVVPGAPKHVVAFMPRCPTPEYVPPFYSESEDDDENEDGNANKVAEGQKDDAAKNTKTTENRKQKRKSTKPQHIPPESGLTPEEEILNNPEEYEKSSLFYRNFPRRSSRAVKPKMYDEDESDEGQNHQVEGNAQQQEQEPNYEQLGEGSSNSHGFKKSKKSNLIRKYYALDRESLKDKKSKDPMYQRESKKHKESKEFKKPKESKEPIEPMKPKRKYTKRKDLTKNPNESTSNNKPTISKKPSKLAKMRKLFQKRGFKGFTSSKSKEPSNPAPEVAPLAQKKKNRRNTKQKRRRPDGHKGGVVSKSIIVLRLNCPLDECATVVRDKYELDAHLAKVHGMKRYRCLVGNCMASFTDKKEFTDHKERTHKNIFWCGKCDYKPKSYPLLFAHIHTIHNEGHYRCAYPGCGFVSTINRLEVTTHRYRHIKGKFDCRECGREFKKKVLLESHMECHQDEEEEEDE